MDLFAFINHADPTKVQIGEREVAVGEIPLLQLTRGRVVPLAGVNDQEDVNAQGAADDEAQAIVADKLKRIRKKRKAADGAGGSGLPPKKLRKDHGVSGNVGASTGGKSVSALQSLLEGSTLAVEVGVTIATIVPFVTSSVTPTLEREGPADSISKTSLRMQHPAKRFVISSNSSHDSNANDADDEVTSIVRSSVSPPYVLTVVVATTLVASATSAPVHESGTGQAQPSNFRDSASLSMVEANVAGPSQPVGVEVSTDTFFVSQDLDSKTLHQV
ncbi:hypothetical protein Tco_0051073, partial [Tanacetum coccineum]